MSKRKLSSDDEKAIVTAIQSGKTAKDLAPIYRVNRPTLGRVVRHVTGKTIWELRRNIAAEAQEERSNLDLITWYQRELEIQNKKIQWYLTIIDTLLELLRKKSSNGTVEGIKPQSNSAPAEQP